MFSNCFAMQVTPIKLMYTIIKNWFFAKDTQTSPPTSLQFSLKIHFSYSINYYLSCYKGKFRIPDLKLYKNMLCKRLFLLITYFHFLFDLPMTSIFLILFVVSGIETTQPTSKPCNASVSISLKIKSNTFSAFYSVTIFVWWS